MKTGIIVLSIALSFLLTVSSAGAIPTINNLQMDSKDFKSLWWPGEFWGNYYVGILIIYYTLLSIGLPDIIAGSLAFILAFPLAFQVTFFPVHR